MLREWQVNLTVDTASGRASCYILESDLDKQWTWVGDTDFGPFDTALDWSKWATKVLSQRKAFLLR